MSRTYFLGLDKSRSGVLNVLFSSQYACHFGSTSWKGKAVGETGVVVVDMLANRARCRQKDVRPGKNAVVKRSIIIAHTNELFKDMLL